LTTFDRNASKLSFFGPVLTAFVPRITSGPYKVQRRFHSAHALSVIAIAILWVGAETVAAARPALEMGQGVRRVSETGLSEPRPWPRRGGEPRWAARSSASAAGGTSATGATWRSRWSDDLSEHYTCSTRVGLIHWRKVGVRVLSDDTRKTLRCARVRATKKLQMLSSLTVVLSAFRMK